MVIFPLIPKMLNKCEGRVATRVGKDMASHFALSVFDLACRTSLLRRQLLVFFFHFCRKCSIWLKSCQKVEKRRWRGKLEKMHMFTSYRFYISHFFFLGKKKARTAEKFQLICFAHRAVDLWLGEWPMAQVHTMNLWFTISFVKSRHKKKCLKSEHGHGKITHLNAATQQAPLKIKMQEETHSNGVDLLSGSGNKLG